jgi:hypothetical protein
MSIFYFILRKLPKILIITIITIFLIINVISSQLCLLIISFMSSYIENPIAGCNQTSSNISVINRYEVLNDRSVWLFCSFLALISSDIINIVQTMLMWRFRSHTYPQLFTDFILVRKIFSSIIKFTQYIQNLKSNLYSINN